MELLSKFSSDESLGLFIGGLAVCGGLLCGIIGILANRLREALFVRVGPDGRAYGKTGWSLSF